jgi:hypothetical protein
MKFGKSDFFTLTTFIIVGAAVIFTVKFTFNYLTQTNFGVLFNQTTATDSNILPRNIDRSVDYKPYFDVGENDSPKHRQVFIPTLFFSSSLPLDLPITTVKTRISEQRNESKRNNLPSLNTFIEEVMDGNGGFVRGVYVYKKLASSVVQQPLGDYAYVSDAANHITQFQNATAYGVIGLLAHNHLSGRLFFDLVFGDEVVIIFGDGHIRTFLVSKISKYQRLEQDNIRSNFVDLNNGERITSAQLFQRYYKGGEGVTFQTCLEKDDVLDWGLIIIEAAPKVEEQIENGIKSKLVDKGLPQIKKLKEVK